LLTYARSALTVTLRHFFFIISRISRISRIIVHTLLFYKNTYKNMRFVSTQKNSKHTLLRVRFLKGYTFYSTYSTYSTYYKKKHH